MDLLTDLRVSLRAKAEEWRARDELGRLSDRSLADIGIERVAIRQVARDSLRYSDPLTADRAPSTMDAVHAGEGFAIELPQLSRVDIARLVAEGERRRDEEVDKLFRSMGAGLKRLILSLGSLIGSTAVARRLTLARVRQHEVRRVRAELESYSDHELSADLRLARSEIGELAAEAGDDRVATFIAEHPEYRAAAGWRERPMAAAHAGA